MKEQLWNTTENYVTKEEIARFTNVFKGCLLQRHQKESVCGKGSRQTYRLIILSIIDIFHIFASMFSVICSRIVVAY